MYKAILKRKNDIEIKIYLPNVELYIYWNEVDPLNIDIFEFTELTPENIIDQGGFTQIQPLKINIICFELIDQISCYTGKKLIYKEI